MLILTITIAIFGNFKSEMRLRRLTLGNLEFWLTTINLIVQNDSTNRCTILLPSLYAFVLRLFTLLYPIPYVWLCKKQIQPVGVQTRSHSKIA